MKVKYIVMKMINGKSAILRDIAEMGTKNFEFFERILDHTAGDYFMAGQYREKIINDLNFSNTTFWDRVKALEDRGILKKTSRGIYRLNTNWVKVFESEVKNS